MKKLSLLSLLIVLFTNCTNENDLTNQTFVGKVKLTSQKEIEDFASKNYTRIDGSLSIVDQPVVNPHSKIADIYDLSPLNKIEEITGRLTIINNDKVTEINGFNNTVIKGGVRIESNTNLQRIIGFNNILDENPKYQDGSIIYVFIEYNYNLQEIKGFNQIEKLSDIQILSNPNLRKVEGFNQLETCLSIFIDQVSIEKMDAFTQLESVSGRVRLSSTKLINFDFLANLKEIGYLELFFNENLNSLKSFNKLKTCNSLEISFNNSLVDLNGLENLNTLQYVKFKENINLTNYCAIFNQLQTFYENGGVYFDGNKFNLSYNDIKTGKCSL
ncbi:hypothetical protein [Tenacibaculum agarivorans]|uniref:hypothetical protein n=1 Tax=Tenacibaculum agarivorans TaxID=1908389 RepID=UPI00094B88B9|nr:hypothetical protein [Tenacibaculum agarivorans]